MKKFILILVSVSIGFFLVGVAEINSAWWSSSRHSGGSSNTSTTRSTNVSRTTSSQSTVRARHNAYRAKQVVKPVSTARARSNVYKVNNIVKNINSTYKKSQTYKQIKFKTYTKPGTGPSDAAYMAAINNTAGLSWNTGGAYYNGTNWVVSGKKTPVYDNWGKLTGYNYQSTTGFFNESPELIHIVDIQVFAPVDLGLSGVSPSRRTPPGSSITCGTSTAGKYFNDKPTNGLCSNNSTPAVSYIPTSWIWTWFCDLQPCFAYENAKCGSAVDEPSIEPPTEDLCSVGSSSEPAPNDDKWSWTCKNAESVKNCSVNKQSPSCSISSSPLRVCPGVTSTVTVDRLVPSDGILTWVVPDGTVTDSTSFEMGVGKATLTVTKGNQSSDCSAIVHPKPAGCTVSLDKTSNLTVGETVTVTVEPSCLGEPSSLSYSLSPSENWSNPQGFHNDGKVGTAVIKVEKAGTLTFNATVNKAGGGSVNCSSQASAFTSGSEWWERRPE